MTGNKISKAIEQEILSSYEKLYRLAFSYVKNEQDAMDVVQESVYKAMKNAGQVKDEKYIKTWLLRITINTAVDATRKQSKFVSDEQVAEEGREDHYEDMDGLNALETLDERTKRYIEEYISANKEMYESRYGWRRFFTHGLYEDEFEPLKYRTNE